MFFHKTEKLLKDVLDYRQGPNNVAIVEIKRTTYWVIGIPVATTDKITKSLG